MTPDEHTISETQLDVGDGHILYVHEWGNLDAAVPIIHLHGGPGAGTSDRHKKWYDPSRQRVVFHDQRGSGNSTPYGSLDHNTTQDLVDDIAKIMDHADIASTVIAGGSWGACLGLAFALAYPERVRALALTGIFTGSRDEVDWLNRGQYRMFFPETWERYLGATPEEHQHDPSGYHLARILGDDEDAAKASAYTFSSMDGSLMRLDDRFTPEDFDSFDPNISRIEAHYFTNDCFMPDEHILQNAHRLTMPVYLIQGRYDMVCPPVTAYRLAAELPQGELTWTTSNHAGERETWNVMRTLLGQLTREPA